MKGQAARGTPADQLVDRFIGVDHPLLDRDEEIELAREVQAGIAAEGRLADHNIRLVLTIAVSMTEGGRTPLALEDAFGHGLGGLARAIRGFDPDRGVRFSTYAVWWIRQAIGRAIESNAHLVRVPHKTARLGFERTHVAMFSELSEEPPDFADEQSRAADEVAEAEEDREQLRRRVRAALNSLPRREREIMMTRYGIGGSGPMTQGELGEREGVTKQRIDQIEKVAKRQLARALAGSE